jgi:hypothetical protein
MGIIVGLFLGVPWHMDFWLDLRGLINPKPNQPLPLMTPFMQFIGSIGQLNGSLINSDFESPKKKHRCPQWHRGTESWRRVPWKNARRRRSWRGARGPWGPGRGNRPGKPAGDLETIKTKKKHGQFWCGLVADAFRTCRLRSFLINLWKNHWKYLKHHEFPGYFPICSRLKLGTSSGQHSQRLRDDLQMKCAAYVEPLKNTRKKSKKNETILDVS